MQSNANPSAVEAAAPTCPLCCEDGGILVHRTGYWRVVRVPDADFPAYYRVIWNAHAAEFTDLTAVERAECMDAVARVERALRDKLSPTKINLASLGNMVPHLHWHVIARFAWDSHFPGPIWAQVQRQCVPAATARLASSLEGVDLAIRSALGATLP